MKYQINHTTEYSYEQPVALQPHIIRLRPRSDNTQILQSFQLSITPTPIQKSQSVDLDGNAIAKVWFDKEPTQSLVIHAKSLVETLRDNPFEYLLEPWATHLPIDYPTTLLTQLHPYLKGQRPGASELDPVAIQLAQEIWVNAGETPVSFLSQLNQQIYQGCQYIIRETGAPLPPGITWTQKSGSCRDFAVLFMETCRAIGLAARFVSGYQEGDRDNPERHLHAWVEVYLPGAGWRGYDPTQGLAVADRHIALVASAFSAHTAPVSGSISPGGVQSNMNYHLNILPID
ncbi:transglutaminase-like enzyme, predicted cysteine protease [Leptolyngbyaceae cyanobacterium JSC-12]|nr:transglutaminase-like enzyme, predicted cysteine protease [Leptolyngbyaceae cyanobacterium JSC-12]